MWCPEPSEFAENAALTMERIPWECWLCGWSTMPPVAATERRGQILLLLRTRRQFGRKRARSQQTSEAVWHVQQKMEGWLRTLGEDELDLRDLQKVEETWGIMQLALWPSYNLQAPSSALSCSDPRTATSLGDLYRSGWPLLLLAKASAWVSEQQSAMKSAEAFYLFEVPADVLQAAAKTAEPL